MASASRKPTDAAVRAAERHPVQLVRPLIVRRSSNHGRGVFTGVPIAAGAPIFSVIGTPVTDDTPMSPYEDARCYQVGIGRYISPTGRFGKYVNHACAPNCGFHMRGDVAMLVAIRDIARGEELTFDYSTIAAEDPWRMACCCGSGECRGEIGEFKDLPPERQRRYLELGVVPEYVRKAAGL